MPNIIGTAVTNWAKKTAINTIANPIDRMVDENLTDITTTIGSFIIRSVRGKFQRSISFTIGVNPADYWMEEALYGILYKYNNIKQKSKLEMTNKRGIMDGSSLYCRLDDGTHNLKFRKWDILLFIQTRNPQSMAGRVSSVRIYTIISYDLSPEFVESFERDMLMHRNALLKIKANSPTINVYKDYHENDGFTYWEKMLNIPKRKLSSIYLPYDQKKKLVDTINNWFASKQFYHDHGIPWNLKILLYGPPGPQPVSIKIPTPNGMRRFGDIKPGDYVFGKNGQPTLVEEVYEYDNLDVYEVEFSDGRKVKCSPEHKWPTITSGGNILEKSVFQMIEEGIIDNDGNYRFRIPLGNEVNFQYKHVSIDPWVLGVFIGNGNLRQKNVLTLSSPNDIIPTYVAAKIGAKVKKHSQDPNDYDWCFYNEDDIPIKTEEFFKDVPEMIHSHSKNKTIPEDYIFNTRDNRYALLQGLMDTDGCIAETNSTNGEYKQYDISFTSTSKELIDQVVFTVRSLGFAASITVDNRYEKYTSGYCGTVLIHCNDDDKNLFFRYSHKVDKAEFIKHGKKNERNQVLMIKSITNLGYKEDMHCLHVRDSLHLYQTTDFAVTCNSGKDSTAKVIASEWNRNIYMCTGGKNGKFIPNAITDESIDINAPLYVISDIDKYPSIINEPDTAIDNKDGAKEDALIQKQIFGNMLNALDGILSGEGRIIIMTTNHIEKFSDAFLRPGRVDLCMEIGYVTSDVFRRYVKDFYNIELPKNIKLTKDDLTVSEMQRDVVFMKLTADEFIKKYVK